MHLIFGAADSAAARGGGEPIRRVALASSSARNVFVSFSEDSHAVCLLCVAEKVRNASVLQPENSCAALQELSPARQLQPNFISIPLVVRAGV